MFPSSRRSRPEVGGTPRALHLIALIVLALLPFAAQAETYVIPIWARALEGSDGTWWAQATVINPNAFPVNVQVTRVFPLRTADCSACPGESESSTIEPFGRFVLQPPSGVPGKRLIAGAVELETTAPVHIHLVAYRPGEREIRQRLDIAHEWLLPGTRTVSSVERAGADWRMNVFITNPGHEDLIVSLWTADRAENEVRAMIAAGTTGVVGLGRPQCNGAPCASIPDFPPPLLPVHVEADGMFLASVSSIGEGWAVFSLADEAVIDNHN